MITIREDNNEGLNGMKNAGTGTVVLVNDDKSL